MTVFSGLAAVGLTAAAAALGWFAWRRRLDVSGGLTIMCGFGTALLFYFAATATGYEPLQWVGLYLLLAAVVVAAVAATVYEIAGYRERRAVRGLALAQGAPTDRRSFRRQPRSPFVIMLLYLVCIACVELLFLGVLSLLKVPRSWWGAPFLDLTAVLGDDGPPTPLPRLMAPLVIGAAAALVHTMVNTFRGA